MEKYSNYLISSKGRIKSQVPKSQPFHEVYMHFQGIFVELSKHLRIFYFLYFVYLVVNRGFLLSQGFANAAPAGAVPEQ